MTKLWRTRSFLRTFPRCHKTCRCERYHVTSEVYCGSRRRNKLPDFHRYRRVHCTIGTHTRRPWNAGAFSLFPGVRRRYIFSVVFLVVFYARPIFINRWPARKATDTSFSRRTNIRGFHYHYCPPLTYTNTRTHRRFQSEYFFYSEYNAKYTRFATRDSGPFVVISFRRRGNIVRYG